uniref:Uncharacterized protein n=1 Tax=Anguilla anguilla TaxID=7936 RepID=A0A0E9TRU6_ANGAN
MMLCFHVSSVPAVLDPLAIETMTAFHNASHTLDYRGASTHWRTGPLHSDDSW